MKEIHLTQGKIALVDDDDFEKIAHYNWFAIKSGNTFYAIRKKGVLMHREILGLSDPKIQVDHKNRDGLNNQKSNIRCCTNRENQQNSIKQKGCKNYYKGVCFDKRIKRWLARIYINSKLTHIGAFINENDAALAYNAAAVKYFGEFARLNIIKELK